MSDSGDMDGVSPTPEDFFDHEPSKLEKLEVSTMLSSSCGQGRNHHIGVLASWFRCCGDSYGILVLFLREEIVTVGLNSKVEFRRCRTWYCSLLRRNAFVALRQVDRHDG